LPPHQLSAAGAPVAATQIFPEGQLQISEPQAVPPDVQSMSFTQDAACAEAAHEIAGTSATMNTTGYNFMAYQSP
jgi:hypothetical protein